MPWWRSLKWPSDVLVVRALLVGHAHHLLYRGVDLHDLDQAPAAQVVDAFGSRLLGDLHGVPVGEDDLLDLLAARHHLVDADAALVAGAAAALAAHRPEGGPAAVDVSLAKAGLEQGLVVQVGRRLAGAQPPRQSLGSDQDDRRGDVEGGAS